MALAATRSCGAIGSSPGGGNALQRYDRRTDQIRLVTSWPESQRGTGASEWRERFNWTYPIVISPHDPSTLYIGGDRVMRSTNEGHSWEPISPDLTRAERADPTMIDGSRRLRIANGSGTKTADVSQLIKQFREMQKLMKRMPGVSGTKSARNKKGKKGRKGGGGRVTPPGGGRTTPKQPFTLPGLN